MRAKRLAIVVALGLATIADRGALAKVQAGDLSALALDRVLSPAIQPLLVTSPAAAGDEPIPDLYTAFGKNVSPPVQWEGAPPGTRAFAVIMEDPDSHGSHPTLHWLVYNIPATYKGLGRNLRNKDEPKGPGTIMQGQNYAGGIGYIGPNPPPGDNAHHYHIQVFALGRVLKIHPGLPLDKVIAAMNDNVLAEGEAVGTFAAPSPAPAGN